MELPCLSPLQHKKVMAGWRGTSHSENMLGQLFLYLLGGHLQQLKVVRRLGKQPALSLGVQACTCMMSLFSSVSACSGLHNQASYRLVSGQEERREGERGRRRRGSGRARDVIIRDEKNRDFVIFFLKTTYSSLGRS